MRSLSFKILFFTYLITLLCLMLFSFDSDQMEIPKQLFGIDIDKIVHFLLFFPFPILAWMSLSETFTKRYGNWSLLIIAISGLALAALTESAQILNPDRSYDPKDMVANFLAILISSLLMTLFFSLKRYFQRISPGKKQ